MVRSQ